MKTIVSIFMVLAAVISGYQAQAFCGFYVANAGAKLFNNKSEVILVRDGNRTTVTMSNDFRGDAADFAMVVPVPVLLQKNDIRVMHRGLFDKLGDYSAPRLVEYYDENPCFQYTYDMLVRSEMHTSVRLSEQESVTEDRDLGVRIEARYEVGEYEILILSANESNGLRTWLTQNGYSIPDQANEVLDPYIKSNMKFFVVKVNLDQFARMNTEYLSPIQITYESDKFMLPIRLGMANANGPQDLIVYAITKQGRVECTNYRTAKLPTDRNIPLSVQPQFGEFYKALFDKAWKQEGRNTVFLEYAWDVSPQNPMKCDPCIGPPPIVYDLREAGATWLTDQNFSGQAFFTRLHVRYERDKFPQDLNFQVTPNTERYQCRYVMNHPAQGDMSCEAGQKYLQRLQDRRKVEQQELAALTGWDQQGKRPIGEDRNEFTPIGGASGRSGRNPQSPIGLGWLLPVAFLVILTSLTLPEYIRKTRSLA